MANALYDLGRNAFLNGSINYTSDTIKVALVSSSYTPNLATDQFWSSVVADVIGTPQTLTGKTTSAGIANADNTTFISVSGSPVFYVVVYKDTGTSSTSPLIALIDTGSGLPVTPNGGNITVNWDTGTFKIFSL